MMTHVTACRLPPFSELHERFQPGDVLACYGVSSPLPPRAAAEVITDFPGWAKALVMLRNAVTAPFGLRTGGDDTADRVGIFPVERETDQELIAGFNDKHLDFRVSVTAQDGRVTLATWVRPHNIGGRVYLNAIMPFHVLIARNALARVGAQPMSGQTA